MTTSAQLLLATIALSGCVAERTFPEPAKMCENLLSTCGDKQIWDYGGPRECFEIGRAGASDPRNEDQCFAVYDECVSDCLYYSFWTNFGVDAGADAGLDSDAANDAPTDAGGADAADE